MTDRIASFTHTSQLIDNNMRIQKKYAEGQIQATTGNKSESYQGIAKDTSQILNLESDYKTLVGQTENAQTALDRTESLYSAIGSIIDTAQSFASDLSAAISGITSEQSISAAAQSSLEQTASDLNTKVADRYIFGGSATQSPPVDIDDPDFGGAIIPSTENTSYYQGNSYTQSVKVDDGLTVEYGVTADNAGIEQILRAYDLVRTSPGDPDTLQEALDLVNSGMDSLINLKAEISQNSQTLDKQINENLDEINLIDSMISGLKEVDLAEVTVKLQELEAQLEASYSVTAELLNLNLSDYI